MLVVQFLETWDIPFERWDECGELVLAGGAVMSVLDSHRLEVESQVAQRQPSNIDVWHSGIKQCH